MDGSRILLDVNHFCGRVIVCMVWDAVGSVVRPGMTCGSGCGGVWSGTPGGLQGRMVPVLDEPWAIASKRLAFHFGVELVFNIAKKK